jgi:hypothetical protein
VGGSVEVSHAHLRGACFARTWRALSRVPLWHLLLSHFVVLSRARAPSLRALAFAFVFASFLRSRPLTSHVVHKAACFLAFIRDVVASVVRV